MGDAKKRVFVAFAVEDRDLRDLLVSQRLHTKTPFDWQDFSVKKPWDENWKANCRTRIRGCDGLIGLITNNTPKADGQLWEIRCGYEEEVPVMLLYGKSDRPVLPNDIAHKRILTWTWDNIRNFIDRI
jgi:hypothetical protein